MSLPRLAALAVAAALASLPSPASAHRPDAPARQGPYSLELVDDGGRVLPTFAHRGRTYVLGVPGQRYLLRIRNGSARRIEVVASVDGRDVVDGRPAAFEKPGYLVDPFGETAIDGYRLSGEAVAAFRFGSVRDSYAARMGDARDVGVVGVAIFPERVPAWRPPPYGYPPGPYDREERAGDGGAGAPAAPAPEAGKSSSAAESGPGRAEARSLDRSRPGLGTEFGERHESHVEEVPFERASGHPAAVLTLRYDDRPGLLAAGVDLDRWGRGRRDETWRREQASPFRSSGFAEPPPGWDAR
ncbi:MAG TPA: hypothetical protein VLS93_00405 [Anaeromyxobacteraceae bacterium]|nr:hypothetical protein [Anaeromyxobacteraceae bacterium]